MATQSELLGVPLEFEYKGKVYKIHRQTFGLEAMFCDWVYHRAVDRIERARAIARLAKRATSEEQYERQMNRLADNFSAGKFEWEGELVNAAGNQPEGIRYMLLLRFRKFDQTVTLELINEILDDPEANARLRNLINPPVQPVEKSPEPAGEQPAESSPEKN